MQQISITDFRSDIFNYTNQVIVDKKTILIKKNGVIVAQLSPPSNSSILEFAGIFFDKNRKKESFTSIRKKADKLWLGARI